jgi:hypothetical protein
VTEIDGHFTWGPPKTEAGRRTATLPAVAAAALDELIEAASALTERPPSAPSGTRVARIGQSDKGRKRPCGLLR